MRVLFCILAILLSESAHAAGGVVNGQPVNAQVTNAAFLFKNADDTENFILTFNKELSCKTIPTPVVFPPVGYVKVYAKADSRLYTLNSSGSESAVGTGTVTSVGLALPADTFTISGSPVTVTGTLTGSYSNQTANFIHAGPSTGPAAPPTWRLMTSTDLPQSPTLTGEITLSSTQFNTIQVGKKITRNSSTGLITGGALTINGGDNTKFDLSAGTAEFVDYTTTPSAPTYKTLSFGPFTAQSVTNLATQDQTYVFVDNTGAITQQSAYPTSIDRRSRAFIGRLGHSNHLNINNASNMSDFTVSNSSQFYDFLDSLGPFNIAGNTILTNGANLTIQKTPGTMFFRGFNVINDARTPHVVSLPANIPMTLQYMTRTGPQGANVTNVDVANYDVGGVITPVPGGGANSTIQRVFLLPTGTIRVQYGQNFYTNLANAQAALGTESFVQNPALANISVLIGYLIVEKSATDMSNTTMAIILPAPRFNSGAGGGVNAVVNLQQTYNASTQAQVVLDPTHLGLQITDNATPIAQSLFSVSNSAVSSRYLDVTSSGLTTSGSITSDGLGNTIKGVPGAFTTFTRTVNNTLSATQFSGVLTNLSTNYGAADDSSKPSWRFGVKGDSFVVERAPSGGGSGFVTQLSVSNTGVVNPGGGGGGAGIKWWDLGGNAAVLQEENGERVYFFNPGLTNELYTSIKIPQSYISGFPIQVFVSGYSPSSSGTIFLQAQSTLIRSGTDAFNSVANQRTTTNAALTNTVSNQLRVFVLDVTSGTGQINGVSASPGDVIKVRLYRTTDTDTAAIRFFENGTDITFR